MDLYSPVFLQVYKQSKSKIPLHIWADAIGKKLPIFKNNPSSVYNTVKLAIKIKGKTNDSNGIVNLRVAPTDADWYPSLQSALKEMTGKNVHVVDYLGNPIEKMTMEQLSQVGELDIVDTATSQTIRLPLSSSCEPPAHMATNKMTTINQWYEKSRDMIANSIADGLTGLTMPEISQATTKDQKLQKIIEKSLQQSHSDWQSFLNTYAMDNVSRSTPMSEKTSNIAQSILHHVREGLKANQLQIKAFHALNGTQGDNLWSDHVSTKVNYKDEHSMYLDIAEDALYSKVLGTKISHLIYRGKRIAKGGHKRNPNISYKASSLKENTGHPVKEFYDQHYYPKFKKYPGHVIEQFNNKEHIKSSAYPGNAERAKDMYRLYSGRFLLNKNPQPAVKNHKIGSRHRLVPLDDIKEEMPRLVPLKKSSSNIKEEMPRLVPLKKPTEKNPKIGAKHRLVPLDDIKEEMPRLVPLKKSSPAISEEMPRLVPLKKTTEKVGAQHRLVPLKTIEKVGAKPRLVPLNQKKVGARHRLVPITEQFDDIDMQIANEDLDTDVFGLPNLSAFLKKK